MASETLNFLMKQYGAAEWLEPRAEAESAPLRGVSARTLIEGMQPLRVQELDVPAGAAGVAGLSRELRYAQRSPMRVTDSIWTDGAEDDARRLVHLRTFECESAAAARAQLLQLLAEFQGPEVRRSDAAGEVSFAAPGNTAIAGVRGNVAFLLTNGGEELLDLSGVAASVDRKLAAGTS
jgi:hypothetical protein